MQMKMLSDLELSMNCFADEAATLLSIVLKHNMGCSRSK